ncbi:hypothetical protein JB92DRAFT_3102620 [Gautieria morchelliformis]|nr:hypothetical protein JB92DRAFT_3102620 [Gautieria morchelliformis]
MTASSLLAECPTVAETIDDRWTREATRGGLSRRIRVPGAWRGTATKELMTYSKTAGKSLYGKRRSTKRISVRVASEPGEQNLKGERRGAKSGAYGAQQPHLAERGKAVTFKVACRKRKSTCDSVAIAASGMSDSALTMKLETPAKDAGLTTVRQY